MKARVAAFWAGLAMRERAMLSLGSLLLVTTLYFIGVVEPLAEARQRAIARLAAAREELAFLNEAAARLSQLAPLPPAAVAVTTPDSFISVLNTSADEHGLGKGLRRIDATGPNEASLTLEGVDYANLMLWILALRDKYGIDVARLQMDRHAQPALVDVQLAVRNLAQTN